MPATKRERVREIRRINARFRGLKKRDGKLADRLCARKDAVIDALQASHRHRVAYESPGSPAHGPFGLGGGPERFCPGCGLVDQLAAPEGYRILGAVRVIAMTPEDYRARQGAALRRLGINLA